MGRKYMQAGTSWNDVEEWLNDLQETHQCRAHLEIRTQALGLAKARGLAVRLVCVYTERSGAYGWLRHYDMAWPTYHCRTMPGLVLALIHRANNDLAERRPLPQKALSLCTYGPGK